MTLESEGRVLLHFAAAYGFRNIQNLVQKLKRGRCPYHYVEVMACPSGILRWPTHRWCRVPLWGSLLLVCQHPPHGHALTLARPVRPQVA